MKKWIVLMIAALAGVSQTAPAQDATTYDISALGTFTLNGSFTGNPVYASSGFYYVPGAGKTVTCSLDGGPAVTYGLSMVGLSGANFVQAST
jgi:hypothetical protein